MKKTIAILLVLVIAGVGLFAAQATASELTINTEIKGVLELGIFTSPKETKATFDSTGVTETANISNTATVGSTEIDPESADNSISNKLYLAVRTNQNTSTIIDITATSLKNANTVPSYMDYTITFDNANKSVVGGTGTVADAVTTLVDDKTTNTEATIATITPETGLRVINFPFTIDVTKEQSDAAEVGIYSATITFKVSAS